MFIVKKRRNAILFCLILLFVAFLITGCARWPEDPNGGGGTGQKQLLVKVEVNDEGKINTDQGNYYIVFDTDKNAPFPPDTDIEDWQQGFYYVKLGDIGFLFGEVLETGSSEQFFTGTISNNSFQVNISLADLGDPEGIHMNVITTDEDNKTYDALDSDYYIDTNLIFSKSATDSLADSDGGADFDIAQVTTTTLIP